MINELAAQNSILNRFIAEMRDVRIQNDQMRFRKNLERAGEIFAYEISKRLNYHEQEVTTPLGMAKAMLPDEDPVIATILRAGLPFHQGFLNYFDRSKSCFISAFRKHKNEEDFDIEVEYISAPGIDGKTLIICDPMLATGSSMVKVYQALVRKGIPRSIHIVSLLSTPEGISTIKKNLPKNITLWTGCIDDELTAHGYIVPGLGDAGDLAFGEKFG